MALICHDRLLTNQLVQKRNTNQTHFIPEQILFGSGYGYGGQSHSLTNAWLTLMTKILFQDTEPRVPCRLIAIAMLKLTI
jgi:hypothetical protein